MKSQEPSFLRVPQQLIAETFLAESPEAEHFTEVMKRSCTAHCVEMLAELTGVRIPDLDNMHKYANFLLKTVASDHHEYSANEVYLVDDGWNNIAVSELLRHDGFAAVVQDLHYGLEDSDFELSTRSGRIASDYERQMLMDLSAYGSIAPSAAWLQALSTSRSRGGFPIVSVVIPSSVTEGAEGRHSVLVLGVSGGFVEFADPDQLIVSRYKERADEQEIERIDPDKLIFRQPEDKFLARMAGNVMHVFSGKRSPA